MIMILFAALLFADALTFDKRRSSALLQPNHTLSKDAEDAARLREGPRTAPSPLDKTMASKDNKKAQVVHRGTLHDVPTPHPLWTTPTPTPDSACTPTPGPTPGPTMHQEL